MAKTQQSLPRWVCGLDYASQVLGRRWVLLVLRELSKGPKRFNQLRKMSVLVPPKSLSRTLVFLERNGFVIRKVDAASPPRVCYTLASEDPTLQKIIPLLTRWGNNRRKKVLDKTRLTAARSLISRHPARPLS